MSDSVKKNKLDIPTIREKVMNLLDRGINEILTNIVDPDTDDLAKRVVSVEVSFTPDEEGEHWDCKAGLKLKLARIEKSSTLIVMKAKGTGIEISEMQSSLDFNKEGQSSILELNQN